MSEQCPLYPHKRTPLITTDMSALCQKQTFCTAAETALFDHFVGAGKYCRRNGEAEYFCGFKIDHQLVLAGRLCPLWVKSRHFAESD